MLEAELGSRVRALMPAVAVLKFLIMFGSGVLGFHSALGPPNYVPGSGWRGGMLWAYGSAAPSGARDSPPP